MSLMQSMPSPRITAMIRLDHMHVLATFHRYHVDSPRWRKTAIVNVACAALEIHAQLEEEIFYPALRAAGVAEVALDKSVPEHDAMRATIASLRSTEPGTNEYDVLFMTLMREVMHHVADEETILLPQAEKTMNAELRALGSRMTRRRLALLAQRPGEIAVNTAGTFPLMTFAIGAFALLGAARLGRRRRTAR
ncbi:hemerythrin domain-containing protein [Paraburkholderia sp. IW21]|uniref:hemerythrin domain-containing protein n=1 Tax=Paraburkholderia sp. IW21 TaxID=3242488 RepID=UPI00352221D7